MERFWNIVHYFAYRADYRIHLFFNRFNPVLLFYKLPFAKRHFKKIGIDPVETVNKAFERPDIGISSIFAGGLMYGLVFLIFFGIVILYQGIIQKIPDINRFRIIIPVLIILSIIINHFLLFKNNKYLTYFKEFAKMERKEKKKWAWISLVTALTILLFAIGCFVFMDYRLHLKN